MLGNHDTGSKVAGVGLSVETDGVNNSSSLTSSKSVLLCKYNFLCLAGSAKPGMIKEEEADRKFKFYNYKKLCFLAKKEFIPYMTVFTWRGLELLTYREGLISWTL